jgi:uncharacterized protein Yka (UPF0111/DUF47 family)
LELLIEACGREASAALGWRPKAIVTEWPASCHTNVSVDVHREYVMASFFGSLFSGDHLWQLFEDQATVVHEGAVALSTLVTTPRSPNSTPVEIDRSEADGVKVARAIEVALRDTFFAPIDREDMYELSSALDGVLSLTARSSRAYVSLGIEPDVMVSPTSRIEDLLVSATNKIREAIGYFRARDYERVVDVSRELRGLHSKAELVHDEAIATLLRDDSHDSPDSWAIVRAKAPLDNAVETVGQCGEVGKLLAYLAVKNS